MFRISVIVSIYDGMKYLEEFLSLLPRQTIFSTSEFILIHNDPTEKELHLVDRFRTEYPLQVQHIIVPRETVYASWNRGVRVARSEMLAIWNIDDIRTPDSLERQALVLESSQEIILTYGDLIYSSDYGEQVGAIKEMPEFNRERFMERHLVGTFVAWKRKVIDDIGYFDEQFKSAGDFDYFIRMAAIGEMKRTPGGVVGYFLNEGEGLSTNSTELALSERNAINLRYGNYNRIDFRYLKGAKKYKKDHILFAGSWHRVHRCFPDYQSFIATKRRSPLLDSIKKMRVSIDGALNSFFSKFASLYGMKSDG